MKNNEKIKISYTGVEQDNSGLTANEKSQILKTVDKSSETISGDIFSKFNNKTQEFEEIINEYPTEEQMDAFKRLKESFDNHIKNYKKEFSESLSAKVDELKQGNLFKNNTRSDGDFNLDGIDNYLQTYITEKTNEFDKTIDDQYLMARNRLLLNIEPNDDNTEIPVYELPDPDQPDNIISITDTIEKNIAEEMKSEILNIKTIFLDTVEKLASNIDTLLDNFKNQIFEDESAKQEAFNELVNQITEIHTQKSDLFEEAQNSIVTIYKNNLNYKDKIANLKAKITEAINAFNNNENKLKEADLQTLEEYRKNNNQYGNITKL